MKTALYVLLILQVFSLRAQHFQAANDLFEEALKYKSDLRFDSASILFKSIASDFEAQGNWEKYYACQHHIAHCLWIIHHSEDARLLCLDMIEEAKQNLGPNHITIAEFHTVLGNIHADRRTQKDYEVGVAHYEDALEIAKKVYGEKHTKVALAYERLGIARYLIDDYAAAIPFYEKALTIIGEPNQGNFNTFYHTYNNLGLIYFGIGNLWEALECFEAAKKLMDQFQTEKNSKYVKVLNNIANIKTQMGDFGEALLILDKAWELELEIGDPDSKIRTYLLGSLGDCYLTMENYSEAINYFKQALKTWNPASRDDANALIREYSRIGECYLNVQQHNIAIDYFLKAYSILDNNYDSDNFTWVDLLTNLGSAYGKTGQYQQGLPILNRALSITHQRVGKKHPAAGKILMEISQIYLDQGRLESAMEWAQKAKNALIITQVSQPNIEQVSSLPNYIAIQNLLGQIGNLQYQRSGNKNNLIKAVDALSQGLIYSDSLKITLQSSDAFAKAQQQVYLLAENAINCLFELWQKDGDPKWLQTAFLFFEKSKSAWLRSSVREWLARSYAGIPKEIINREFALKSELTFYQNLLNQKTSDTDVYKSKVWRERFFKARQELDQLLKNLEANYAAYYQLKYDYQVVNFEAVKQFAKDQNLAMVTYFWGEENAYAISIQGEETRWIKIEGKTDLEVQLSQFYGLINQPSSQWLQDQERIKQFRDFCQYAKLIYEKLLAPILESGTKNRLVIIPDGPLGRLPFQALLDREIDQQTYQNLDYRKLPYLISSRPVQYEFAATLLLQEQIPKAGKDYYGYAPSFERNPLSNSIKNQQDSLRVNRLYHPNLLRDGWGTLEYNIEEIEATNAILGGVTFVNQAATEYAFKIHAGGAKVLHLATHAFAHDTEPDYSSLVFVADTSQLEDGQLYAYELYNIPLEAELAVLSACNTGEGKLLQGEGIMSLSRAFQFAGCSTVLMSLWPADDGTTKQIVVDFFKNLNQGTSKSKSLQIATINFLKNTKNDLLVHPAFWANLVIIGKNNPVQLNDSSDLAWTDLITPGSVGLLLLVVILLFQLRKRTNG